MSNAFSSLIFKTVLFTVTLQYALPAQAQLASNSYKSHAVNKPAHYLTDANTDTLESKQDSSIFASATPVEKALKLYDDELLQNTNAEASITTPKERRKLMGYLKTVTSNEDVNYNQSHAKFLYHLANVFARLRLYPLAMKCFLKTTAIRTKYPADSLAQTDSSAYLAINAKDDSLVASQALFSKSPGYNTKKSKATTYKYITSALDDGKKAVAYAMLFHVKQPVPGKRKIFVWGNTGHTFITLIKYNADSTYSSFSFGFYPKKVNLLSATPVEPETASVFKDDTNHQWDEVLGKFISKRRFEKILLLAKQYDHLEYHLSNNNCTDFGLKAAQLAGINIDGTTGSWPLGHGNNPAITGQSILEGKFNDADTGKAEDLFINTIVP
ncbi:hypothetical protein FO440_10925 [Mucilaginibacter corticis]|uniref:DUF4105 domain-containing protein n=1 Tax=Mucilaginibacter corticis TaxID=2597670 RepID=A0A556MK71_9SPHI|nr:hypothetical protein [Mucilaginibacter corticis]TSJ40269.1 hypothetical protein FO440_10925 [Mucilaginibacter corticis]